MIRIGVELLQLKPGESGGIVAMWTGVLKELFSLTSDCEFVVFTAPHNQDLLTVIQPAIADHIDWIEITGPDIWKEMDRHAFALGIDVLIRSYPIDENTYFPLERQIFVIPDLQHEAFPELFDPQDLARRRLAFDQVVREAGAVGVISQATLTALEQHYAHINGHVFFMPPSLPLRAQKGDTDVQITEAELEAVPDAPFFFYPANLWPHKNHRALFAALKTFNHRREDKHALVLTGHPGGWDELANEIEGEPIYHLGFVREPLLDMLFQRAVALTFFSLYEGFGIPLLQAFKAGTPVLCSDTTSLPEVGGHAVLTCAPTNVSAMAHLMDRIVSDDKLHRALVDQGRGRLAHYQWAASAQNLLNACRNTHDATAVRRPMLARLGELFARWEKSSQLAAEKEEFIQVQNQLLESLQGSLLEKEAVIQEQLAQQTRRDRKLWSQFFARTKT